MDNRFWVGGTGNWSDNVNHWSASDGGAPNASTPTNSDNVFFTANSFSGASQVVTVDAAANCLAMDWTGAANSPTLAFSNSIAAYGAVTFIDAMTITNGGNYAVNFNPPGAVGVTFPAGSIPLLVAMTGAGTLTFDTNLTTTLTVQHNIGTLNLNGKTVSCSGFATSTAATKTLTMGAATVTTTAPTGWDSVTGGGALTVTANTATINVTGTGAVALGDANWNGASFNLNGTAHTVSGNPTGITTLALPSGTTQTITITAGNRITCTTATLSGDASHAHTIQSGTSGTLASIWATNKTDAYVTYTNILRNYNGVIVADCSGTGGGTFAGAGGTFTSLTIQGSGNYALTISGSNTFTSIHIDASSAAKTLTITSGTTQMVSSLTRDAGTNTITIQKSSSGTYALTFV